MPQPCSGIHRQSAGVCNRLGCSRLGASDLFLVDLQVALLLGEDVDVNLGR